MDPAGAAPQVAGPVATQAKAPLRRQIQARLLLAPGIALGLGIDQHRARDGPHVARGLRDHQAADAAVVEVRDQVQAGRGAPVPGGAQRARLLRLQVEVGNAEVAADVVALRVLCAAEGAVGAQRFLGRRGAECLAVLELEDMLLARLVDGAQARVEAAAVMAVAIQAQAGAGAEGPAPLRLQLRIGREVAEVVVVYLPGQWGVGVELALALGGQAGPVGRGQGRGRLCMVLVPAQAGLQLLSNFMSWKP